jgi:hypothetical protein
MAPVIDIFDMAGKKLIGPLQNHVIPVSGIGNGVYSIRFKTGNTQYTQKLILRK